MGERGLNNVHLVLLRALVAAGKKKNGPSEKLGPFVLL
jgi:hypothetical protein